MTTHAQSIELMQILSAEIPNLAANVALEAGGEKNDKTCKRILNRLLKKLLAQKGHEEPKKRKRTATEAEPVCKKRCVSDMTHKQSCAAVGLHPRQRGINFLPCKTKLFFQCQTKESTIYDDVFSRNFYYDFQASPSGKMVEKISDLKVGTVNHRIYELFNAQGGIHVIAAFGGLNKWRHESFYVSGFTMLDGCLKIVCSGMRVPRPLAIALENETTM